MVFCIETQTLYAEHRFFFLLNYSTFRCIWIHFDPKWNQTRFISIDELYVFLRDNYMVAPSLRRASWWWYLIILGSQMSRNHLPRFATRSIMVIMRRGSRAHAHRHYGNGHYLINCIFQMQTDAVSCCFVLFSLWRRFIGRRRQCGLVFFSDKLCKLIETIYPRVMLPRIAPIFTTRTHLLFCPHLRAKSKQSQKMMDYFGKSVSCGCRLKVMPKSFHIFRLWSVIVSIKISFFVANTIIIDTPDEYACELDFNTI